MNRNGCIDDHLAKVQLFRGLSKRQLRTVSHLGTRIDGEPGMVLTREGRPGSEFIIVLDGKVEVRGGDRVLATRGPGDYLGEIALLGTRPRTATAVAKTHVVIEVMSRREFSSLLLEAPELSDQLRATMTDRLTRHEPPDERVARAS
jgi:CRP-like cAMP-binding protein